MRYTRKGLLALGLLVLAGTARAVPAELRLAYTSETVGEIDPCG